MFTKLLLILSASSLLSSIAIGQKKFTIQGSVEGVADGTPIALYRNDGTVLTPSATDTIRNGAFSFMDTTTTVFLYALRGLNDNFPMMRLDVWAAPGANIKVYGKGYYIKTWQVTSKVHEQRETDGYLKPNIALWEQLQEAAIAQRKLSSQRAKATAEEKKRLKETGDSLGRIESSLRDSIWKSELAMMQRHSLFTKIWLSKLKDLSLDVKYNPNTRFRQQAVQLYEQLPENLQKSRIGAEIEGNLFPPVVVKAGEKMADADLVDLQEKKRRLADYKGKYLLLDFWSVGCGPCLMAMPELKALSDTLKDRLTVVSLNIDDKRSLWKRTSEKEQISWVNLNDDRGMTGLAARYGVNGIPHYVMISPEGTVLGHWIGYEKGKLSEKVREYLTKKESASAF
jgi:thiol-disulfide isomerase/thioredoxin